MSELHQAVINGDVCAVRRMLGEGAHLNAPAALDVSGGTPLHLAAFWGQSEIAQLLLDHGADVNSRDATGDTPLHWAVRQRNALTVRTLLDRGADVNLCNDRGETPLHCALREGDSELEKLLREHGDCE